MTTNNLTEQWKNGQLKSFRWYYVKFKTGEIDVCWLTEWSNDEFGTGGQYFDGIEDKNILEVLAPVPSYSDCLINEALIKDLSKKVNKLIKENEKLKGLLKECKPYVIRNVVFTTVNRAEVVDLESNILLTKIDEVLK